MRLIVACSFFFVFFAVFVNNNHKPYAGDEYWRNPKLSIIGALQSGFSEGCDRNRRCWILILDSLHVLTRNWFAAESKTTREPADKTLRKGKYPTVSVRLNTLHGSLFCKNSR